MTDWYPQGREPSTFRGGAKKTTAKKAPAPRKKAAAGKGGGKAGSPWGRSSMDALLNAAGRQDAANLDRQAAPLRQVSLLGVDPRSSEGQQIMDYLTSGADPSMPEVQELVEQYQSKLIGPLTSRVRSEKVAPGRTGLTYNQYGYMKGDEYAELDRLGAEALARTQDRLAALGILEGFLPGKRDARTVEAFSGVLQLSNSEGVSWAEMLGDLERQKVEMGDDWVFDLDGKEKDRQPFITPAYLAPDYATLAQTVTDQMRQVLGRDPDESEIGQLTAELDGWYKGEFNEEVAAMRSEYDAGVEADEVGRAQAAGEFRKVDPVARFKQAFEAKFADEIDFIEDRDETQRQGKVIQSGISTLSQMSGGMG